jgi:hypothetical protein
MRSSVPGFKAALLARLGADPNITGPDLMVTWGNPYPLSESGELVVVGNVANRKKAFVAGMTAANETYDLEVLVSVVGAVANDTPAREARAYALADAVDESIRTWNLSGGPLASGDGWQVSSCLPADSHEQDALLSGASREASVMQTYSVMARLTA